MFKHVKLVVAIAGLICMIACKAPAALAQSAKPTVFALNAESLQKNKARIRSNNAAVMPAYSKLIKEADKALKRAPVSVMEKKNLPPSGDKHDYMSLAPYHWPNPEKADGLPYIRKDGQTNPEVKEYKDKEYLPKLCADVYHLGLAYYFSGKEMYAEHAAKLVQVWFLNSDTRMNPNLNFGQAIKGVTTGRGAGMIDTRHFVKLVDGLNLIETSKAYTAANQAGMRHWFSEFLRWMQTSKIGMDEMKAENNHGAWYDAQRLALALYTKNDALAKEVVASTKKRLDQQMAADGSFPKEMERTISLHYSTFVMEALFQVAHMAEKTGTDLWSWKTASGKSLEKGFEVLKPYWLKEAEWKGPQIKPFEYEAAYPLLMDGATYYRCADCPEKIKTLAADDAEALLVNLLY